jgi:protein-L-isoaspartate(D-aspartate) O-methyltransferase
VDPAAYGRAALAGRYRECEREVVEMFSDLLAKRQQYAARDGERFFDAVQNAHLVTNSERYYRVMYYGLSESWNLRDAHMFDTLMMLLGLRGEGSRAVVWAHNSHVGTIAAARDWDEPMEVRPIRPSLEGSYERVCHDSGVADFLLPLRAADADPRAREGLETPRLERAIGVVYRPETELQSHYFRARLPRQFDEYVWFDVTRAVTPLPTTRLDGVPDTYPFGL